MTSPLRPLLEFGVPLTSPLLALAVLFALRPLRARVASPWGRAAALAGIGAAWFCLYHLVARHEDVERWLAALNTPLVSVFLLVVLPALHLRGTRAYRPFLAVPAVILALGALSVADAYRAIPAAEREFCFVLIRPAYLMGAIASLLVLLQPLLSLTWFRRAVRTAGILVLLYGGFAFRTDFENYRQMVGRRADRTAARMFLDDTIPVLASDYRLLYVPAAPCRFSADGGYVQGCNVELFQRILQVDLSKAAAGDPPALHALHLALSALLLFLVLVFISGRWTCGWLCPLSTLGDILSFLRAKLRIPYFKPGRRLLASGVPTGLSLLGIALLMARAFPSLDSAGRFLGCKIPIYPFCKLCPAQQVCPVAAKGPAGYPPIPTAEWAFGFFTVGSLGLLALFLVCFLAARRLWCRFCPMGMISGVFNRGGMVDLVKDGARCNGCGVCAEVCPMEIDTVRTEMARRHVGCYDCVLCMRCVEHCPRDGCLSVDHAGIKVAESRFR